MHEEVIGLKLNFMDVFGVRMAAPTPSDDLEASVNIIKRFW